MHSVRPVSPRAGGAISHYPSPSYDAERRAPMTGREAYARSQQNRRVTSMTVEAKAEVVDHHDPASLLGRMHDEIRSVCTEAPAVWRRCADQACIGSGRPRAIVLTGCGDSYYAGLSVRQLMEDLTGIPTVVWPAMEVTISPSHLLSPEALLVGVSVSGKVGRTIEAVEAHTARGGGTVAVTASTTSRLAATAGRAVITGVHGTPGPVPGTSTYVASVLGLMSIGIGLAQESRQAAANEQVFATLGMLPNLLPEAERFSRKVVTDLREPFFAVGSGADAGTAHFAVAKFLEAAGVIGVPQDLEEWAHEQYFATDESRTLLLCVNDERVLDRGRDVAEMASSVGGRVAGVGLAALDSRCAVSVGIPAVGAAMAPLLAWLPFAEAALEYARQFSRFPFGTDRPDRMDIADRSIYAPSTTRAARA